MKYESLSIKDLLDAREIFHIHLMKKSNVVGTAIGKYRQRLKTGNDAKRLDNTKVEANSWPCILVFVDHWLTPEEFKKQNSLDDFIPTKVYMPDGREVPLCVIEAPPTDTTQDLVSEEELIFPSDYVGGGYPLLIEAQGTQRVASIGCVVSDGNKYYAVTNRHVTGAKGTIVCTRVKGTAVPIGKSAGKDLGNVFFRKLYNGWEASSLVVNVDVGLIEIDDIKFWKTDIFKLGALGKVYDLSTVNLSLDLIGRPVKAYGGVSGELEGEITALFYRYKSVGGLEYLCDFLIGPPKNLLSLTTKNGDSGTLWVVEEADSKGRKVNRPIAIQWGQHCFFQGGQTFKHTYALATCLSNVLRELEVDIVSGWNDDLGYTWGEVGHYTIANFAAAMVTDPALKTLLKNNLELITFQQNDLLTDASIKRKRKSINYTPLADVPDLVWKIPGGEYRRTLENPNHFADMDKPDSNNQTLLQLCSGKGAKMKFLTPEEWLSYYTDKAVKDSSKGILPFRVWQIFIQMTKYASKGNVAGYLSAAGILAHYVGDACQPLHISYMFNGIPAGGRGEGKKGDGVHEAFEKVLINKHNKEIIPAVNTLIKKAPYKNLLDLKSGKEAGAATVDLMKASFNTVAPKSIVDAFVKDGKEFADKYWKSKGKTIIPVLFASGASTLASLWNSAWVLGTKAKKIKNLDAIDPDDIMTFYQDENFIPSVNILGIKPFLS